MTENNQNLVPEIRFNGFTNAWEQRKLGEVFDQTSVYVNPKRDDIELWSLTVENGLTPKTERYNREFLVKKEDAFKAVFPEEFIYNPMNMTLGAIDLNLLGKKVAVSGYYVTMRINKNHSSKYFSVWLKTQKALKLYKMSATGGLTEKQRVQFPILSSIGTLMPSHPEQSAIGNFFHTLDDTITLHKRKLNGLRELKKGYLQQMFPQPGERVPRVRFAGFSGEWQERKLGELFKERNERSSEGELISVTINSGVIKASELERKDNSSEDKSNYKKVEVGDIAYNSMRMWQGASGISNYAGILSPAYTVIIPNEGVDSLFFSYMFKLTRMIEIFQSFSQGLTSDTWNLKFPLLKEIYVTVPCSNEQAAISDFFRIIDEQITAQAIKLEQLGQLKAAYLQRMFI